MSYKDRTPIIVVPGKGPITFPPQGPGPVFPPPWNKPGNGGLPIFPSLPKDPDKENKLLVAIKSVYADSFVKVGKDGYLYATGVNYYDGDVFRIIILDENQVHIRVKGGNFIRLDDREFLVADTDKKGATKFRVYSINKNEYVLMSPNGYFVRVRDKDNLLVAKAEEAGPKTIFKLRKIED